MSDEYSRVEAAAAFLRPRIDAAPDLAIVLGSGLGDFSSSLHDATPVPYEEIPNWPAAAVVGHAGTLVVGRLGARRVAALSGRAHCYEGHTFQTAAFATRVMRRLGVRTLVLTNAAGGINLAFKPGTLMVIDDHINLMGGSPLGGLNDERFGPRFPDMTEAYSKRLRQIADEAAQSRGIPVAHGIYAAMHGPSYETPAEIRFLRTIGADAVGMSTVPEVILARHCGLRVAAVSAITNLAEGMGGEALSHEQTLKYAAAAAGDLARLVERFCEALAT
jgi:purine-nucleoside phosphorylase